MYVASMYHGLTLLLHPHTLSVSLKIGSFKPLSGVVINNPGCVYFPLELKKVLSNVFYGVVPSHGDCDGVCSVVAIFQAGALWSGDRCCSYGDEENDHHSLACPGLPPSHSICNPLEQNETSIYTPLYSCVKKSKTCVSFVIFVALSWDTYT